MKRYCSCCGKQAIKGNTPRDDKYCTIIRGAVTDCNPDYVICGYCAEDLDENGLFPGECGYSGPLMKYKR